MVKSEKRNLRVERLAHFQDCKVDKTDEVVEKVKVYYLFAYYFFFVLN